MRVLVACEFSGVVRDAFLERGHDAISCDLLPSERPGPHIQGDVRNLDLAQYDLMIAHPPCTYLASVGLSWNVRYPERNALTEKAIEFVLFLLNAPVPRVCVENPVGVLNTRLRPGPDQIINPFQFGHEERKRTCLFLENLPLLHPTRVVTPEGGYKRWNGKKVYFVDRQGPSPDRWKIRSRTFPGIAAAMAEQWGKD